MPTLAHLEFVNCFKDLAAFNITECVFLALKHRKRHIRNLTLTDTYIGEGNLFALCGLANKGLVTDKLTIKGGKVFTPPILSQSERESQQKGGLLSIFRKTQVPEIVVRSNIQ